MRKFQSFGRVRKYLSLKLLALIPMSGELRYKCLRFIGVKILGKTGFVGKDVSLDTIRPDLIEIEENAYITEGTIIYTHYLIANNFALKKGSWFRFGSVHIGRNAFIGARTIICNSVNIGNFSIVAAGSIVTKDIPPYEVWGGNPAKFIKSIPHE